MMNTEDKFVAILIGVLFTVILSIAVGVTWNNLAETSAIENMVTSGADPIAVACSMGSVTACQTSERIEAYGLR